MKNERASDLALVQRVQNGDKQAFNLIVKKYQGKLFRLVHYLVHDRDEAEDVLQDAFLRAYRALDRFRGESALYTWLFRIAYNTATAHITSRKRRLAEPGPSPAYDDDSGMVPEEGLDLVTPEDICSCKEMVDIVSAALDSLASEQSMAITLHEVDGLSYQEIAEVTRTPIGTVRSRIANAREVIARRLERVTRAPVARHC